MPTCKSIGCGKEAHPGHDFCSTCLFNETDGRLGQPKPAAKPGFRDLGDMSEIDVFAVHHLFQINDPSGCLQLASRQILSSGPTPSPGHIREARDALSRWLQLNPS